MKRHAKSKKDFEAARLGVFAIPGAVLSLPKGPLLTHLNCGIRVQETRRSDSKPDRGIVNSFVEVLNQKREVVMSVKTVNFVRSGRG